MATSSIVKNCDLCERDHVTKKADAYCPQCDDALCFDCKKYHKLSKASKTHETITMEDYLKLPPFIRTIKQSCEEHGGPLEFFCPNHDELCCKICNNYRHKKCQGIGFIPEMVKRTDLSSQVLCYLNTLEDAIENLKIAITERQTNLADIKQQSQVIIKEVKQKKEEIINHLDKLEQELSQSLLAIESKIKQDIQKLIDEMEEKSKKAVNLKAEIDAMKKHASDVQLFMGTKELKDPVASIEKYTMSTYESGSLTRTNIVVSFNKQINSLTDDIRSFASITTTSNPQTVKFNWQQEKSAQIMTLRKRTFIDISLQFKQTLQFGEITACIISTEGDIIVGKKASDRNSEISKYACDGKFISKLLIKDSLCFDIVSVDEDTLAVTGGYMLHNIYIINVNNLKVAKVIRCDDWNYGVTCHDGSLICCTLSQGIQRIEIPTEKCTTIVSGGFKKTNIVSDDKFLYLSNKQLNYIVCYDFKGNIKWTYQNELLQSPRGITIDSNSNLFVAGYKSNNIVVISSDGKQGRELIGPKDGLCKPNNMKINIKRNLLIFVSGSGTVFLNELIS